MSQSTIFAILMILLSKRKVTRDYLAERFSVSVRTVSRYITELIDAGIPIISTSGHHGGYSLADDYIVDKSVITEAESLRIKDALGKTVPLYDDKVNLALIEKLNAVDAVRAQDKYVIKQDNLYIDYDDCQASEMKSKIKTLSEAIEQTRATDIKYTDARGAVSYRTIEPYTLVFKAGAWYIYAMCRLRGDFRLFKLTRISDLRKTSKRFVKLESKLIEKLELEFYNEIYVDLEFEFFPAVTESVVDWLGNTSRYRARHKARGARRSAHERRAYKKTTLLRLVDKSAATVRYTRSIARRSKAHEQAVRRIDLSPNI